MKVRNRKCSPTTVNDIKVDGLFRLSYILHLFIVLQLFCNFEDSQWMCLHAKLKYNPAQRVSPKPGESFVAHYLEILDTNICFFCLVHRSALSLRNPRYLESNVSVNSVIRIDVSKDKVIFSLYFPFFVNFSNSKNKLLVSWLALVDGKLRGMRIFPDQDIWIDLM